MQQVKWFDREFDFDSPQNIFPSIMERLAGTPVRLEEKFKNISSNILTERAGDTWTIKENAGHLTDLEPLWQGRFNDIINGKRELRIADLQNTQTTLADHNEKPVDELLQSFRRIRQQTIQFLEGINEEMIFRSAFHPRLKTPMRTMDLFLFVAEHDDHHLARMTELIKLMNKRYAN
ncbi:MAG: DinB family protein [Chitinophagaceae bacterium]